MALHRQTYIAPSSGRRVRITVGTVTQMRSYMHMQTTDPYTILCHGVKGPLNLSGNLWMHGWLWLYLDSVTSFNVVIAILSVFLLLIKGIMFITHVFDPLFSVLLHATLVSLYAVSLHNQTAPDMSDPQHPQPGAPWYITKSCGPPVKPSLKGYCTQAKAVFAVTVLLL